MVLDDDMPIVARCHQYGAQPPERAPRLRLGHCLLFVVAVSLLLDASMHAAAFFKQTPPAASGRPQPGPFDQQLRSEIESWREKVDRRLKVDLKHRDKNKVDLSEELNRSARENPTGRTIRQL